MSCVTCHVFVLFVFYRNVKLVCGGTHYCPKDHALGLTVGRLAAAGLKKGDYSALLARRKGKLKKSPSFMAFLHSPFLSSRQTGQSSPPSLAQKLQGAQLSGPLRPPVVCYQWGFPVSFLMNHSFKVEPS